MIHCPTLPHLSSHKFCRTIRIATEVKRVEQQDNTTPRLLKKKASPEHAEQHNFSDSGLQVISGAPSQNPYEISFCTTVIYTPFQRPKILMLIAWRLMLSGAHHHFRVSILLSKASTTPCYGLSQLQSYVIKFNTMQHHGTLLVLSAIPSIHLRCLCCLCSWLECLFPRRMDVPIKTIQACSHGLRQCANKHFPREVRCDAILSSGLTRHAPRRPRALSF